MRSVRTRNFTVPNYILTYEAARNWSLKTNVKSHQKCEIKTAMFEFDIRQKLDEKTKKNSKRK